MSAAVSNLFQSGDLTGWTPSLQAGPSGPAPVAPLVQRCSSGYVGRFDVLSGQKRQELVTGGAATGPWNPVAINDGDDTYFGSAYLLDPAFPLTSTWQVLHQWITPAGDTTAGTGMQAGAWGTNQWLISGCGFPGCGSKEVHSLGALAPGQWTRFVVRIRFSSDPAASIVQVWRSDGSAPFARVFDSNAKKAETINTVQAETRPGWWQSFAGEPAGSQGGTFRKGCPSGYEKHGLYRDPGLASDARLASRGIVWAGSLLDAVSALS